MTVNSDFQSIKAQLPPQDTVDRLRTPATEEVARKEKEVTGKLTAAQLLYTQNLLENSRKIAQYEAEVDSAMKNASLDKLSSCCQFGLCRISMSIDDVD